eukprot:2279624-Alexandrium_andersonii.AAC.1
MYFRHCCMGPERKWRCLPDPIPSSSSSSSASAAPPSSLCVCGRPYIPNLCGSTGCRAMFVIPQRCSQGV